MVKFPDKALEGSVQVLLVAEDLDRLDLSQSMEEIKEVALMRELSI
jgi:hypothetical protein